MKKAAHILTAALLLVLPLSIRETVPVYADSFVTYAYISRDTRLYTENGESLCLLPSTYFVVLSGESVGGKYPVSYADLTGFVDCDAVNIVDYEPVTKFHTRYAYPDNDGMAVNLRDKPSSQSGTVLCAVPNGARLTLYGEKSGNELFVGAGTSWQFVRYDAPNGSVVYGYAYSAQLICDSVSPNVIEKVTRPKSEITSVDGGMQLDEIGKTVIAAALCVPAGIFMLVLFRKPDESRAPRHRKPQ